MNWKVFSACAASTVLFLTAENLVQACGGGEDPYDFYPSFFDNRAVGAPAYTPFQYAPYETFYGAYTYGDDTDFVEGPVPDANLLEWKEYTDGVATEDLDSFIYTYSYDDLSTLYYHLEKGGPLTLSAAVKNNGLTRWFMQRKDLEALGYLMHAKKCEPLATAEVYESWETPPPPDTSGAARLIRAGQQLHAAAKKPAIRQRYAYQILRTAFYTERYRQVLELYNTLGAENFNGEMWARCRGLRAGALAKTGRKTEAAYLYSTLFGAHDGRKTSDFLSYKFVDGFENKAAVLKLCKTDAERATVYVLHGLRETGEALPLMEAAYSADPSAPGLQVLLAREIAKVEQYVLRDRLVSERGVAARGWYYDNYAIYDAKESAAKRRAYEPYAARLARFARTLSGADAGGRRGYYTIAEAYLTLLDGDAAKAGDLLKAAPTAGLSAREADLRRVMQALVLVRGAGRMNADVESELLPHLQWLEGRGETDARLAKSYRDFMSTVLSTAYLKDRDTVKAVYALSRGNMAYDEATGRSGYGPDLDFQDLSGSLLESMSGARLGAVKAYAADKKKSPYDRWLTGGTVTYSTDVLLELEGTKLLREHRFADAEAVLARCSGKILQRHLLPDPFIAYTEDQQERLSSDSGTMYNKREFARRMADLQKASGAMSRMEYATGLYSMTYYGKAHRAFDYFRSTSDDYAYYTSNGYRSLPAPLREYYGAYAAEEAFKKAAAAATDPDAKARALWMAGKCWQKRCPEPTGREVYNRTRDEYYIHSLRNPYFADLAASAAGTEFWADAKTRCAYLRDYVNKR